MAFLTPALSVEKAQYLRKGMGDVRGWLEPSTAVYMATIESEQRRSGLTGDVCEIGVYNGKSFLTLAIDLREPDVAHAIDAFDDADEGYGLGNREQFEKNLAAHGAAANAVVTAGNSTELEAQGFLEAGRRFRIFSIDGGHSAEVTANDLWLAERTVVDGGVVLLDDFINRAWLGVITGMFDYWQAGGTLVPSVYIPNKLVLNRDAEQAAAFKAWMSEHFAGGLEKSNIELGKAEINIYTNRPWEILDEDGGVGPVLGATPPAPKANATKPAVKTRTVPESYLRELERRVPPLRSRLARRLPGLARVARPVYRRLRRTR